MISPLSFPSLSYVNRFPQTNRFGEQAAATAGRQQAGAPVADPQSLGRMPPVTGKDQAEGNVRTNKEPPRVKECQTCKNRKYQDGSDDPGVSFKTPGKIDPDSAAGKVRSHEQEHVTRERAKAEREGREVVSQSVTLHTAICPECGRAYVSGGTTRTVTRSGGEEQFSPEQKERGTAFDVRV